MPKIYIIGPVGSGKTTLANKMYEDLNIPVYHLDEVVWEKHNGADIKRSDEEIKKLFDKILMQDAWIIEDVGRNKFFRGVIKADTIIFLNIKKSVLYRRILLRWIKQKLGLEKAPYRQGFKELKQMFEWAAKDIKNNKLNGLDDYLDKIVVLNEKTIKRYQYDGRRI